jgi:hypothetical protein
MRDLPTDRVWGKLDERFTVEDYLREQISPFGGTVGDLIDSTSKKMICTAVVEEKFYHTWHFGRTLLLGDGKQHDALEEHVHDNCYGSQWCTHLPPFLLFDVFVLFIVVYIACHKVNYSLLKAPFEYLL